MNNGHTLTLAREATPERGMEAQGIQERATRLSESRLPWLGLKLERLAGIERPAQVREPTPMVGVETLSIKV